MTLSADDFANTNDNFSKVTFNVTPGYQEITPVEAEVIVTITGNTSSVEYDGAEHVITGYEITSISNDLYTAADFSKPAQDAEVATAKRTDQGKTDMALSASDFANTNANFSKVTFNVTPGYQEITPVEAEVIVTITDRKSTRLNSSHTDSSRMPSSA